MNFKLWTSEAVSPKSVQLNSQFRMPIDAYGCADTCIILDVVDMSNLNWKVILDESFRSITNEGFLEFTIKEFIPYDLRALWLFLGQASYSRKCTLLNYQWIQGNIHSIRLRVVRNIQDANSWSICYVSDGVDIAQINQTADLIAAIQNVEILVSGPKDKLLGLRKNVIVLDDQHLVRNAMIAEKKNILIETAKNQNVLLLHDRYLISKTFFSDFEDFGYDFSIAIPKQLYFESLIEYPGLLVEEESGKIRSVEQHVSRSDFFINGGCIVIKRELARFIPLNSFLAWQEMEDIDWSARLIQSGEIPRPVRNAVVYTVNTNKNKTSSILPIFFEIGSIDFFSELDCLAANHPIIFFVRLPDLISLYISESKYRRKLIAKVEAGRRSWDSLDPIHFTPLRFSFVLSLSLFCKLGKRPVEISRRRIFFKVLSYLRVLVLENGFKTLLIIPGLLYLFSKKPSLFGRSSNSD